MFGSFNQWHLRAWFDLWLCSTVLNVPQCALKQNFICCYHCLLLSSKLTQRHHQCKMKVDLFILLLLLWYNANWHLFAMFLTPPSVRCLCSESNHTIGRQIINFLSSSSVLSEMTKMVSIMLSTRVSLLSFQEGDNLVRKCFCNSWMESALLMLLPIRLILLHRKPNLPIDHNWLKTFALCLDLNWAFWTFYVSQRLWVHPIWIPMSFVIM